MKTKPLDQTTRAYSKSKSVIAPLAALCLSCSAAFAADLFEIRVDNSPVFGPGFTVGDKSMIRLVDKLINAEDQFRTLSIRPSFGASATYYGVPDALRFSVTDNQSVIQPRITALLSSSLTRFNVSFSGRTRAEVEDQIEEWLKKDGAAELARLDEEISKLSAAAPNDGNPFATTASLATDSFGRYGIGTQHRDPGTSGDKGEAVAAAADQMQISFGVGTGLSYSTATIKTPVGKLNASRFDLPIEMGFPLIKDRLRLEVAVPLNVTEIEQNYIYGAGINLGLPWRIKSIGEDSRWGWQLTPIGGVMGRVDIEGANGALVWHVGVASMLQYEVSKGLTVALGNQIGTFQDIGLEIAGVDIRRNVDQRILNNGIRVSKDLGRRWTVQGYIVDSRFLEDAAIDGFQTYGAHAVYNFSKSFYLGTAVDYIHSSKFEAVRVGLSSSFRF